MLQETILNSVRSAIRGVLRRVALTLLGAVVASFGIICVLMGLLRLLTIVLPEWVAWIIIGSHALLIGALLVVVSMPRRR